MSSRLERSLNERIIMLQENINLDLCCADYKISGSSNKCYNINIGIPTEKKSLVGATCSCPDFSFRGVTCKHIYFVLQNVLNFNQNIISQQNIFTCTRVILKNKLKARQEKLEKENINFPSHEEKHILRKPIGDCPICLESMDDQNESIIFCEKVCGNNVHTVCIERFAKMSGKFNCPYCRADWDK